MNNLLIQSILKDNVVLRAELNALTDAYASYIRAKGGITRAEFQEMQMRPARKKYLTEILASDTRLTEKSKQELRRKYIDDQYPEL